MRRLLSLITIGFTMVTLASTPSFASMFVAPTAKEKPRNPEQKTPDPKKLLEAQPTLVAVKHCLALSGIITEHMQLIDAFNNQPDLENLPENMDFADRQKTTLYMMGRPDIPDFGFLIPQTWSVTGRNDRQKFNSVSILKLAELIGFRYAGYPFQGNCKPVLEGGITKDKTGFEHARVSMPLAFDAKETKLVYLLKKQPKYSWQIDDLLIQDVGVTNYIKKDLTTSINKKGVAETTREICKSSSFSTLKCN